MIVPGSSMFMLVASCGGLAIWLDLDITQEKTEQYCKQKTFKTHCSWHE